MRADKTGTSWQTSLGGKSDPLPDLQVFKSPLLLFGCFAETVVHLHKYEGRLLPGEVRRSKGVGGGGGPEGRGGP